MKRRNLVSVTSTAAFGQAFVGLPELALPTGHVLPSRLGMVHVRTVVGVTERWRGVVRYYGGQAEVVSAVAMSYTRWMRVPATDEVTARLATALAEVHTEAGWACYDSGLDGAGHFTRALRLAGTARDTYGIAHAALHAGMTLVRTGNPNDALKLLQLGGFSSAPTTRGYRRLPRGWPGRPPPTPGWVVLMRPSAASERRGRGGSPAMRSSAREPIS
ncbi:MAG: hypothetical protein ACRDRS_10660 [Pseudonocardiaceae bacterium]